MNVVGKNKEKTHGDDIFVVFAESLESVGGIFGIVYIVQKQASFIRSLLSSIARKWRKEMFVTQLVFVPLYSLWLLLLLLLLLWWWWWWRQSRNGLSIE